MPIHHHPFHDIAIITAYDNGRIPFIEAMGMSIPFSVFPFSFLFFFSSPCLGLVLVDMRSPAYAATLSGISSCPVGVSSPEPAFGSALLPGDQVRVVFYCFITGLLPPTFTDRYSYVSSRSHFFLLALFPACHALLFVSPHLFCVPVFLL